jgi:hypothetical protein
MRAALATDSRGAGTAALATAFARGVSSQTMTGARLTSTANAGHMTTSTLA